MGTVVVVLCGVSCGFSPNIADGAFACASDGACPSGYSCALDGRCYRPGAGPPRVLPDGGDPNASGDAGGSGPVGPFSIGGAVSTLTGKGLVLQDVGTDDLPLSMNGPFAFGTKLPTGALYNVTVSSQPSEPTQACTVTNGSGQVAGADVTSVSVACATAAFSVGGVVVELGGKTGLKLTNNGADELAVPANATTFTFPSKVPSGSGFAVAIAQQPTGGSCVVSGGTGTIGVTDVTSVVVNCDPTKFTVGGSVSGLVGTAVLQNNGGGDLTVTANGTFAFATPIATGMPYAVTVKNDPAYPPREQACTVANGSGTIAGANVTNVTVTCTTKTFTIGGSVTGLNGMVTLQNNGKDDLTIAASGPFTFKTAIASGDTYKVTVSGQPSGQTCTVTSNTGTVTNANVMNVGVTCTATNPGILCGSIYCNPSTEICCADGKAPSCQPKALATCKDQYFCDDVADCAATAGTICCGSVDANGNLKGTSCVPEKNCTGTVICDPDATTTACPEKDHSCKTGGILKAPEFVKNEYGACQP